MLPPTVKQFLFKLLISIFVHDYKNVLRQYRQAYTTQRQMEQYLRVITPEDLYDKELVRISERMSDLQKLYLSTAKKGTKRRGNISQTKSTVTQNTKTSRSRRIRYSPNFPIFQLRYKRKRR